MNDNQYEIITKKNLKGKALGKEIVDKYTPKKDLNRKAADYISKHISLKSVVRFETCSSWMHFLTNKEMSKKRLHKTDSCGNRFCPICTWKTAKKDAIKISVILSAIKEIEKREYLFLTLTAPNCKGEDLRDEINRFNKAVKRLFDRRNVKRVVKGYIRKLEVTTDQEQYVTEDLYRRKKKYYELRGIKVGDPNPTYDTYHPHVHIVVAVNKSYFNKPTEFISKAEWLEMWRQCMNDKSITQVDARKVSARSNSNAVLEIAKYSAKGSDLYHSEKVFDTFYTSLKRRQLLVYSGVCKEYAKDYENGKLDRFKEIDDAIYTHLMKSIWKGANYENRLRELTTEEFEDYNKRAIMVEEDDDI